MADSRLLCQEGRVVSINAPHLHVKILSTSACAQCHANDFCTSLDRTEKIIEAIPVSSSEFLKIGDKVTLVMEEKWGWLAVFYCPLSS
jgi:positive regulator of sigma E activity